MQKLMNMSLIESMLLSKDEEVKKLAFNYIKTNYNIDFTVYLDSSKYKYSLSVESGEYFAHMEHILNKIIERNYFSISYIQEIIKLILEYNEKYK